MLWDQLGIELWPDHQSDTHLTEPSVVSIFNWLLMFFCFLQDLFRSILFQNYHQLFLHIKHYNIYYHIIFFFFFDLVFTALSRIFHLYQADRSSKVDKNWRTRGKTTWPSVSRTWLSHMWQEQGSNQSGPFKNISLISSRRSSKVGENQRTRGKTTWPSISRTWLSHKWPERGSNHSGEKPNGLRVNSPIH